MPERKQIDYQKIRDDAEIDAMQKGITNPNELKRIADDAERQTKFRIGRESETRFKKLIGNYDFVLNVRDVGYEDDIDNGIDFWIEIDPSQNLPPEVPVQVKTSPESVNKFRRDKRYLNKGELMLVLSCGEEVDEIEFDKQLMQEIERFKKVLKHKRVFFL